MTNNEEQEHTPGPWYASDLLTVCKVDGGAVAQCFWVSGAISAEQAQANARLIAAAPDMKDALIGAFYVIAGRDLAHRVQANGWQWPDDAPQHVSIVAEKVRAAIAKAERLSVIEGG